MNFWFQLVGSMTSKFAEPGSAPSPEVATEPFTSQYSGLGAAAGMMVADAIVILGTPRAFRAVVLQFAANTEVFVNAMQGNAASAIRKTKERNHPRISARIFICVPPGRVCGISLLSFFSLFSLSESSPKCPQMSLVQIFHMRNQKPRDRRPPVRSLLFRHALT